MPRPPFGHESPSVETPVLLKAGAVLLVSTAVVLTVLYFVLLHGVASDYPAAARRPGRIPPAPHLQPHPQRDLARFLAGKSARLDGYAWVDASHAFARIPIRRAMQIYAAGQAGDQPAGPPTSSVTGRKR